MDAINNKVANGGATSQGVYAAGESNQVTSEILNAITASGATPSASVLDQLIAALDRFSTGFAIWCNDTGSGGAYNLSHGNNSFTRTAIYTGLTLKFRPSSANTSSTPNLTYRAVTYAIVGEETALLAGDIDTTRDCEIRFNGTTFVVLQRSIAPQIANVYPDGYISGLLMPRYDAANLGIEKGSCSTISNPPGTKINADLSSTIIKNITLTWVSGSGGGRPSSVALTANTWYRVFVIAGSSGTDAGFDTSNNASNLLAAAGAGFVNYRQIGWVKTDASSGMIGYTQRASDPNLFVYDHHDTSDMSQAFTYSTMNDVRQTVTSVRSPSSCYATVLASVEYTSSNNARWFRLNVTGAGTADNAISASNQVLSNQTNSSGDSYGAGFVNVFVGNSREYYVKLFSNASAAPTVTLTVHSFRFERE